MGRNEIRLRRQSVSSGRIAQHRNYGELMARHEKELRMKRIIRMFMYFLIIAFFVILYVIVKRVTERQDSPKKPTSAWVQNTPGIN
jgi:large-conductance mechanosensitive channel